MAHPFQGEIRMVAFNFAPHNWAFCDGQILDINTNQALFSLLGTQYGGNGISTFALPELQGRIPIGAGNGVGLTPRFIGQRSGLEDVILNPTQIPSHTHTVMASEGTINQSTINGNYLAKDARMYVATKGSNTSASMPDYTIDEAGQSNGHNNIMRSLVLSFIIAMQGVYPSRS